jgi:peptidoglycan hydrolase-like protein with peptidoglycan-binding domain
MTRPTLRRGASDRTAVEALQSLLNKVGALLDIDGDFGAGTERAVREAQELAGLAVTGIADASQWAWLEMRPDPSPDLPTEAVTFIVREEVGGRAY